jgi:hypothetical protein
MRMLSLLLQEQPFVEASLPMAGSAPVAKSLLLQEQPFVEAIIGHIGDKSSSVVAAPSGAALR